jgi:hypothetical protein
MALFVHPCQGGLNALSQRIEHADVAFAMKQYVQTDVACGLGCLLRLGPFRSVSFTDRFTERLADLRITVA